MKIFMASLPHCPIAPLISVPMTRTRLEAFSDGVIAILITIMVLELRLKDAPEWSTLRDAAPDFVAYLLSFIYLGIYWTNHHHFMYAIDRVNGAILWANLHLLFWLSIVPGTTSWLGRNSHAAIPTAAYGISLLMPSVAWLIMQRVIIRSQGPDSKLAALIGNDRKGMLSGALYVIAIPLAFVLPLASDVIYGIVAMMWLVPDRRVERHVSK